MLILITYKSLYSHWLFCNPCKKYWINHQYNAWIHARHHTQFGSLFYPQTDDDLQRRNNFDWFRFGFLLDMLFLVVRLSLSHVRGWSEGEKSTISSHASLKFDFSSTLNHCNVCISGCNFVTVCWHRRPGHRSAQSVNPSHYVIVCFRYQCHAIAQCSARKHVIIRSLEIWINPIQIDDFLIKAVQNRKVRIILKSEAS